ncbi:NAD(P)H-dependent oxidoreductase [Actinokineospora bangkokensis]|uniref:NADPH-dependent FMN reductase n=1 Tax=Actinokineospora bangkokensis TaxID=1193682 RepID=A0A1Q9LDS1_9PSEU|nr:NAD(P)H-dependent oxidoreductase [Actinokineospora bangkokensis]OLR90188.1 NADPH-dependent FMN reductase [Actinokineospora bangkokensis]
MSTVLIISGSPSSTARPGVVATLVATALTAAGHSADLLAVRDLPTVALLAEDRAEPAISAALSAVESADGLVVVSPVYRAAYSGLVKSLLDLLPTGALVGKAVLPLATGGSQGHLVALDFVLRPLLFAMGATKVLPGHFVPDRMIEEPGTGTGAVLAPARKALEDALVPFQDALRKASALTA